MNYNSVGFLDMIVSRIGLGCLHFDKAENPEAIVNMALDNGINYIDTARAYGRSEQLIGRVMKSRRNECYLASKVIKRSKAKAIIDINTSLNNLSTDMIDVYCCHAVSTKAHYSRVINDNGALGALEDAKRDGKIRYTGISTHDVNIAIQAICDGYFDVIMIPVNIVDLDFVMKVIPVARQYTMGIIGMKALTGGAFIYPDIAINYALAQDTDTQLIGVKSVAELEQDIAIAESFEGLSEDAENKLLEEAKILGKDFCRQCGYCLPCTVGIDIPKVFLYERDAKRYYAEPFAKERYVKLDKNATDCIKCGKCEKRCPYELPIREKLINVHKLLG